MNAPLTVVEDSPLFAQAYEIDARLRGRALRRGQSVAEDAFDLATCKKLGLYRLLGYSSITRYAYAVNGYGSSKTSDLIKIAEACAELPRTREEFVAGRLPWTKARWIVKRATPENEEEWLEKARLLSVTELAAEVNERPPTYKRLLDELEGQELGWLEAVADGVRHSGGPYGLGKALAEACRRMLHGESNVVGGPTHRLVIDYCPSCKTATRETTEGSVPVDAAELEQILCDAEVLDIRDGPAKVSRTVPPKVRNYVVA